MPLVYASMCTDIVIYCGWYGAYLEKRTHKQQERGDDEREGRKEGKEHTGAG